MGVFSAFRLNNMNPHTYTHTLHKFNTTHLLHALYAVPQERKRLFPPKAVKSLIVIIIIQKCKLSSKKMKIMKET